MANIPHLAFPFRLSDLGAAVTEQDSAVEIAQAVEVVLRYRKGDRYEVPSFGITDPTFEEIVDIESIRSELLVWEPRAELVAGRTIVSELIQRIAIDVEERTDA
jgi:phage baseplate assembly protein W